MFSISWGRAKKSILKNIHADGAGVATLSDTNVRF